MKKNLFQMYELEAYLGDFIEDFDVDAIINESTDVDSDGDRVWTATGDDFIEIVKRHEK